MRPFGYPTVVLTFTTLLLKPHSLATVLGLSLPKRLVLLSLTLVLTVSNERLPVKVAWPDVGWDNEWVLDCKDGVVRQLTGTKSDSTNVMGVEWRQ